MLHGVQGGYYWKSFGKHGPLHNPYAYGYFDHVPHTRLPAAATSPSAASSTEATASPRGSATSTSPPTCSATRVYWHDARAATARRSARATAATLLLANDTWFAPSDVTLGPDGCVYVADWHDQRTAHPDPDADWDRSNGRIYRIAYGDPPPAGDVDLAKRSSEELIGSACPPERLVRSHRAPVLGRPPLTRR